MSHYHVAFQAIINEICRYTVLMYYRLDLDLVLECDASRVSMGMTLVQPGSFGIKFIDVTCLKPLTFASKTLNPTEQCYANSQREMLAVVFGLKKFEYYTLDCQTLVLCDYKPLSYISSKDIRSVPPHLQCMLLR